MLYTFITKHKMKFRVISLVTSICATAILICTLLEVFPAWSFYIMYLLFYISLMPVAVVDIETPVDFVTHFLLTINSLLILSAVFAGLINLLFGNEYISIYFGISSFFIFSYLYEKLFKSIGSHNTRSFICSYLDHKGVTEAWGRSAAVIGYLCNIARIILLILDVFDKQYNLGLRSWPLSEAIVTSLAFEKVIKSSPKR